MNHSPQYLNASVSSHFVEVENRKLHYLEAGTGDVILLLHGWPTSSYLWRNIMPELAKTHRVIAMDLPGFGRSDKELEDSYSFRFYYRMIDGLLKELDVSKVTLGLHDLGGPVGLYWAVQDWNRVDKLIFFNTLVYPELSMAVKIFGLATVLPLVRTWLTSQRGIKWALKFGIHDHKKLQEQAVEEYRATFLEKDAQRALRKSVQHLSPKGLVEIQQKLPDFKGPVLIIYGEKDRILPDVAKTMRRVKADLPQAHLFSIPNCGHFLQEEVAEEIVELVVPFMSNQLA